ncbi:MAG: efflux RND transporter periplasmic adaptor subunit [Microscillaceae bacterium]|nr:efflux RND transporter periplasmic adaptor subunit [Microscillaceae bacterium]
MKKYHFVIFAFLMAELWACQNTAPETNKSLDLSPEKNTVVLRAAQIKTIGLSWGKSIPRNLAKSLFANGVVDVPPQNQATVHARQEGFVQSIQILPGDFVQKGQVLAVLENRGYLQMQESYLMVRSELAYLQKELQRQETLRAADINALKTLQQIERDLQIKQAQEASLRQQLALLGLNTSQLSAQRLQAYFSLFSPITGYVEAVELSLGEFVRQDRPLVRIKGSEHKHLEIKVFEKEAAQVQKGQKVRFQVPALGGDTLEAEVFLVGQSLDLESKTIHLHAHILLPSVEQRLKPGMFINAQIQLQAQVWETLPEEAIVRDGTQYVVFVKEKANRSATVKFRKVPVEVLSEEGAYRAFKPRQKVKAGADYVQKGAYYLLAKMRNLGEEE